MSINTYGKCNVSINKVYESEDDLKSSRANAALAVGLSYMCTLK